jgi:hypothetical protein
MNNYWLFSGPDENKKHQRKGANYDFFGSFKIKSGHNESQLIIRLSPITSPISFMRIEKSVQIKPCLCFVFLFLDFCDNLVDYHNNYLINLIL